MYLDKIH